MVATLADRPCADASWQRPAAAASPGRDTILIVEDQDTIAGLIACVAARGGYRTIRAGNGAESMKLFREHGARIALATLDCTLPDSNGPALCQQLRQQARGLPVLFVSARNLRALRDLVAADAPTGFVAKPFFPAALLQEMRELIAAAV